MITTISLINTHHHTVTTFYFLLMRTFKIYSLSNLQIQTGALLVTTASRYMTSPGLMYHVTGSLDLLGAIIPFCSFPNPYLWQHYKSVFPVPMTLLFLFRAHM